MAALSTSPPPLAGSPESERRDPPPSHTLLSNPNAPRVQNVSKKTIAIHSIPPANGTRIRDAPVSPVRVNDQADNWAQPSSADIEFTQPQSSYALVDRTRERPSDSPTTPRSPVSSAAHSTLRAVHDEPVEAQGTSTSTTGHASSEQAQQARPTDTTQGKGAMLNVEFSQDSSLGLDRYEPSAMDPRERVRNQDAYRNSRESDDTTSTTQQFASMESSARTSASSVSGPNENQDGQANDNSCESSVIDGNFAGNQAVPQFQYHHQQPPQTQRVSSLPQEDGRTFSQPNLLDAGHIKRHLTPNSNFRRSSLPRPHSSYSTLSDRSRSPGLLGPQMRAPSAQSRKSPDARQSSYIELLTVPYPQQAPAPILMDNSNLRGVIGNNASLLSTQKTLEMYRANVKKTNDVSIQYSFAVFLISTAQEQGLDYANPKAKKNAPQPLRDLDSPVIEANVSSPYDLVREAKAILTRLANGGYPFAQYYLADGYASGLFNKGKEDYQSAYPLFTLAAKHGHAESAYRTALCHEFGWGCRKDPTKAVQFLRTAASKSHPGAMTRLGKACLSGDLGEKRYREGIKWMRMAREHADSQYNAAPYQLGCLYETGYGEDIFQDLNYAAELFTQAAELGHPEANFRMGDAYEHGRLNCPKDPALSVHFYTGAAEREHAAAMMGLCAWYMVGAQPILEKDEHEAYEWARRSAELGKMPRNPRHNIDVLVLTMSRFCEGPVRRWLLHGDGNRLPSRHTRSQRLVRQGS